MNNDENKKNDLFKVNIDDDDFMNPDELDNLFPTPMQSGRKKFEVHIDEDVPSLDFDEQPQYKGEIYFSNRKPVKPTTAAAPVEHSPRSKKKKKRIFFSSAVSILCIVVLIFTSAFSAFAISCINDIFAFSRSDEVVKITISDNLTTDEVIDILAENGLVKQKAFCKFFYNMFSLLKNFGKETEPDPPVYLSDVYYVEKNLGLEGYLSKFKGVQQSADTVTLVFPEGWTIYQMFDKIEEFGVCTKQELLASLKGATFNYDFIDEIPDNADRTFALEGYFYPDTYEFYEKSDANSVIRKFLDGSKSKWTEEYEKRRIELGLTRDEVITIASIIQREAANKEQMSLISSVLHNRLNHSVSWPLLGCDSTANYIKKYVSPNVTSAEAFNYEQKYNTYISQGLPPGPICNPGDDAINAALYPDDTNYYYFRHDKYGEIYMAKTQSEHDANAIEVLRANSR